MNQYEGKLGKAVQDMIRIETEKAHLFRFGSKETRMIRERERILTLIKETQQLYFEMGKIETRIYENKMKSYVSRLSEIDSDLALFEANRAMKSSTGFFSKIFKKKIIS